MNVFKAAFKWLQSKFHGLHNLAHLAYFAAVGIEAHGFYGMLGGVLFFMGILSLFDGDEV